MIPKKGQYEETACCKRLDVLPEELEVYYGAWKSSMNV
jgi:hypothetical protein